MIVESQGVQRIASIGCVVSDGNKYYALTNKHVLDRFQGSAYDESKYAQLVATQKQTDHKAEMVEASDYSLLDQLVDIYDEPYADSSAIPTYRVCQLARRHVTVALSGDGGDEDFIGYRRYKLFAMEERLRSRLPAAIAQAGIRRARPLVSEAGLGAASAAR